MRAKRITRPAAWVAAAALLVASQTAALAAGAMSERQARTAAVNILKGDPYGKTDAQVLKNITEAQLVTAGSVCGKKVTRPVWRFQVFVPKARNTATDSDIRGYLVIDGRTGKMVCAGLPLLD